MLSLRERIVRRRRIRPSSPPKRTGYRGGRGYVRGTRAEGAANRVDLVRFRADRDKIRGARGLALVDLRYVRLGFVRLPTGSRRIRTVLRGSAQPQSNSDRRRSTPPGVSPPRNHRRPNMDEIHPDAPHAARPRRHPVQRHRDLPGCERVLPGSGQGLSEWLQGYKTAFVGQNEPDSGLLGSNRRLPDRREKRDNR